MANQIEYAYTCHIGKVRNNNEDNFWCCGEMLEADHQGLDHIRSGRVSQSELPLLAVFDGMGGESCGEVASWLAARSCGEFYEREKSRIREDAETFLAQVCGEMNRRVCDYSRENKIRSMGTTAAMVVFSPEGVYGCNLGDSRIYLSRDGEFRRISRDHVIGGSLFGKAPLVQYVGIPEESMALEPSIVREEPEIGTRCLICSDGISDMLTDGEIEELMGGETPVEETAELLLERALKKGGRDNATLILCQVMEQEKGWLRKLMNRFHRRHEGE